MAAGLGSRYGGLKQLATFGPQGQRIIDYSIYDAMRYGFSEVLFIIREDIYDVFYDNILRPWSHHISCRVVFQRTDDLPTKFQHLASTRTKPWGTAHAVYAARKAIQNPFAIINADDFYGQKTFEILAHHLRKLGPHSSEGFLISFLLRHTLSPHGQVSRGLCKLNPDGTLAHIEEYTKIHINPDGNLTGISSEGNQHTLSPDTPVSMNVWGFSPVFFHFLEKSLHTFLQHLLEDPDPGAEFGLPTVIEEHISIQNLTVRVYPTTAHWFGVTHPEDRPYVEKALAELARQNLYPSSLPPR